MAIVTERDDRILMAIQEIGDGVLARRHLKRLFWPDKTKRAMQRVLSRLYHRGYIDRETVHYPRTKTPRSEPVYWLQWAGIFRVAEQMGLAEPYRPKSDGENQMRILKRELRAEGIRWVRTPPSAGKLEHDFFVVDFRLKVEQAAAQLPGVTVTWINESAFRTPQMDKVRYTVKDRNGQRVERERGVCPDGFVLIEDNERKRKGLPHKLRLLIEIDMGTHPVESRFARSKAAPYAAYIGSPAFKTRFAANTGNWLIITSLKGRMDKLRSETLKIAEEGARWFFFAYWGELGRNVLTDLIWHKIGEDEPIGLLT